MSYDETSFIEVDIWVFGIYFLTLLLTKKVYEWKMSTEIRGVIQMSLLVKGVDNVNIKAHRMFINETKGIIEVS